MAIMSFVIRQKATGQYLQGERAWTLCLEDALRFNSGLNLVQYIERVSPELRPENLEVEVLPNTASVAVGLATS
jgi:hypothetical protein